MAARIIVTGAAITGLGVVALVVTFLFSLYGSYQRREIEVVALEAAAGTPPSAVALLETYAQLDLVGRLPQLFLDWERWAVEVLDSHVAFPLLGYFRSSHDNLSWISALGTVLDTASLVLTTICDVPRGDAKLFKRVGHPPGRGHRQPGLSTVDKPPASIARRSIWPATDSRTRAMPSSRATRHGPSSKPPGQRTPSGWRRWLPTGRPRRPRGSAIRSP